MSESASGFSLPEAGPPHELLKPFAGTFRAVVKLWMQGPEPVVQEGTMINSWQLSNLYLFQNYMGDPPPAPNRPFLGQGFWGYNFGQKKYEGFWIDNASSVMQMESGSVDDSGTVWSMDSSVIHPHTGKTIYKRTEIRLIDNDNHIMTTWMTLEGGQEFRSMEITYRRVS